MITFKQPEDLAKLPATDLAYPTVEDLIDRLITEYTRRVKPTTPTTTATSP